MSQRKTVTVGIITFNGAQRVHNLLSSIEKWNDRPEGYQVDLLLVDDGSHEPHLQSTLWVSKHHQIPVLFHSENKGISKSWNDICQYGNSDIIVLLNDDILVSQDWLTCMVYFLEQNPRAGAAGWNFHFIVEADVPAILEADEPIDIYRDPHDKRLLSQRHQPKPERPVRIMAATGSCFAFRRECYEMVSGFDEQFVSFYEETDFGTSLAAAGYPSFQLPHPLLYHQWGKTFEENASVLNPAKLMSNSRRAYKEKWGGDTDVTHPRFMDVIEPSEVHWLDAELNEQKAIIE